MSALTARLNRHDPFEVGFPLLVVAVAVMVGLLAGFDPKLAVGAALAVVLLLVTMHSLLAGMTAFIVLSFMELVPGLTGPALSLSKVAGAILVVSWLAYSTSNAEPAHRSSRSPSRRSPPSCCSTSPGTWSAWSGPRTAPPPSSRP